MKAILTVFCMWASLAVAASPETYKLDDPAILGSYGFNSPTIEPQFESLEIRYNLDNVLVVVRDGDYEYELTEPDENGVIYQGEDEPNCGSGDEANCLWDSNITITLVKGETFNGDEGPQLRFELTVSDAYDETYEETYSYVLGWRAEIPDAVPYYYNAEATAELEHRVELCKAAANEAGLWNANDYCSFTSNFRLREGVDPDLALEDLVQDWSDGDVILASTEDLNVQLFDVLKKNLAAEEDLQDLKKFAAVASKVDAVKDYIFESSSKTYLEIEEYGSVKVYSLDTQNRMVNIYYFSID